MPKLTRRRMLLGLAGAAGFAGVAGASGALAVRGDWFITRWLGALIRGHLPGVAIAGREIDAFVAEAARDFNLKYHAVGLYRTLLPGRPIPVPALEAQAAGIERKLLSAFLTGSNFFSIDPAREAVAYIGSGPCANPFARFDEA